MVSITQNQKEALLVLLKDYTNFYNANSLSKVIQISHVGAQKILKGFKEEDITKTQNIGKSIVHRANLENDYTQKLIKFLLADEANKFTRWKEEFKGLSTENSIVIIYGSAIKNYKQANDIDIMIITAQPEFKLIDEEIKNVQKLLPKKIHAIKLTKKDFLENVKNKNKAVVDIVKNAVVLYGEDKYVEVMKSVAGF